MTLVLLLLCPVTVATLGLWLTAKFVWNQPPFVSQRFRPAEVPVLANRAKNAALEFHHDLNTAQFGRARTLALAHAQSLVQDRAQACAGSVGCSAQPGGVYTRATLVRAEARSAIVRAESFDSQGRLLDEATYQLTREQGRWLVEGLSR